jgi:hypothetical protein
MLREPSPRPAKIRPLPALVNSCCASSFSANHESGVERKMEISDLATTLVVLAASATWLGPDKRSNLDMLKEMATLGRMRCLNSAYFWFDAKASVPYCQA